MPLHPHCHFRACDASESAPQFADNSIPLLLVDADDPRMGSPHRLRYILYLSGTNTEVDLRDSGRSSLSLPYYHLRSLPLPTIVVEPFHITPIHFIIIQSQQQASESFNIPTNSSSSCTYYNPLRRCSGSISPPPPGGRPHRTELYGHGQHERALRRFRRMAVEF